MTSVTGGASHKTVSAKQNCGGDNDFVQEEPGHDRSAEGAQNNRGPKEPLEFSSVDDRLVEDETTTETSPSSKDHSTDARGPASKQTNEDAHESTTSKEVPELGKIRSILQVDRVVNEAGKGDRCEEASEADSWLEEFAADKDEQETDGQEESTEVGSVICEVSPERADTQSRASRLRYRVDKR